MQEMNGKTISEIDACVEWIVIKKARIYDLFIGLKV